MIQKHPKRLLHFHVHQNLKSTEWVTLIHGAGGSSAIWFKQIRAFQKHFNVLLIDLRGHGQSKFIYPSNEEEYRFEDISNEVIDVLHELKIRCSHFIGISMGTIIIRDIEKRASYLVKTMILAGATMKLNFRGQILIHFGDIFKSIIPYLILYKLFAFIIMPKRSNAEARNLFIQEAKKLDQAEFKKWFGMVSQINPLLTTFRNEESSTKSLYIMGEEDYMFLPSIKKLITQFKSYQLIVLPRCGHVVNIEKHLIFNDVCIQFLKSE